MESREKISNIAFYRFVRVRDPEVTRDFLLKLCRAQGLKGTLLVAEEGLNGMLAGPREEIKKFLEIFKRDQRFKETPIKESFSETVPFKRLIVKVKKEILTLRTANVDPIRETGSYMKPRDLCRRLTNGDDILLIDVRNDFEVGYGTFKGALNPKTRSFSEFSQFVKNLKVEKEREIVTFCTGGIRCEKGTALLIKEGYKNVSQLEGGILEYLSQTSTEPTNFFEGACFVFDERVALDRNLNPI